MQTMITVQKIKMNQIKFGYTLNLVAESRRTLRNILNYRPAFFKTERCKRSILSYGVNIYNKLPEYIKNETRMQIFANDS